jgi:ketosteroid isomerase-like protein
MSTERDQFVNEFLPRQIEAEEALHNGDPEPRLALWSRQDPVTVLGAWGLATEGWEGCEKVFRYVASRFSNVSDYTFELVAADVIGDMAYTVGYESETVSMDGKEPKQARLRVTHVYRREDGEWKIVHRHGDMTTPDDLPPEGG